MCSNPFSRDYWVKLSSIDNFTCVSYDNRSKLWNAFCSQCCAGVDDPHNSQLKWMDSRFKLCYQFFLFFFRIKNFFRRRRRRRTPVGKMKWHPKPMKSNEVNCRWLITSKFGCQFGKLPSHLNDICILKKNYSILLCASHTKRSQLHSATGWSFFELCSFFLSTLSSSRIFIFLSFCFPIQVRLIDSVLKSTTEFILFSLLIAVCFIEMFSVWLWFISV